MATSIKTNLTLNEAITETRKVAEHYHIDLDKEYPAVLEEIETRRKNGDFDHEE